MTSLACSSGLVGRYDRPDAVASVPGRESESALGLRRRADPRDSVGAVRRLNAMRLDALLALVCGALALAELFYWDEWSGESKALQLVGTLVICAAVALRR